MPNPSFSPFAPHHIDHVAPPQAAGSIGDSDPYGLGTQIINGLATLGLGIAAIVHPRNIGLALLYLPAVAANNLRAGSGDHVSYVYRHHELSGFDGTSQYFKIARIDDNSGTIAHALMSGTHDTYSWGININLMAGTDALQVCWHGADPRYIPQGLRIAETALGERYLELQGTNSSGTQTLTSSSIHGISFYPIEFKHSADTTIVKSYDFASLGSLSGGCFFDLGMANSQYTWMNGNAATLKVDEDKVVVDGTVGIGISNPQVPLHVSKDGTSGSLIEIESLSSGTQAAGVSGSGVITTYRTGSGYYGAFGGYSDGTVNMGLWVNTASGTPTFLFSTGGIKVPSGTAALPAVSRIGDPDTGLWFPGADTLAWSTGGTERVRVTNIGQLLVATATARTIASISPVLGIESTSASTRSLAIALNYAAGILGPVISLARSRSSVSNGQTIVQNGDHLGVLLFSGTDGTATIEAAYIRGEVDGSPGTNDMPSRLVFGTTPDGSATMTERMRIDNSGKVGIGTNSPLSKLHVAGVITAGDVSSAVNGATILRFRELTDEYRLVLGDLRSSGDSFFALNLIADPVNANTFLSGRAGTTGGGAWVIRGDGTTRFISAASQTMTVGGTVTTVERVRIDSAGLALFGLTTARANFDNAAGTPKLQIEGLSDSDASLSITQSGSSASLSPRYISAGNAAVRLAATPSSKAETFLDEYPSKATMVPKWSPAPASPPP